MESYPKFHNEVGVPIVRRITRAASRAASTIRSERALYLYRGNQDTYFRLHGTNEPETIGEKVSSGCIRLFNHDIIDLYDRVSVGAPVVVLQEAREPFRADAEADGLASRPLSRPE
jgi:lipoprotein-anchoring transpeptidase ErfK/SrfK